MTRNWANKYQDRWFVRVDGKGNPVYGSLIPRTYNPSQGSNRFIEVTACIHNICCAIPATTVTLLPTDFEVGGTIVFGISDAQGSLLNVILNNDTSHNLTVLDLVDYLNTNYSGYGTFSVINSNTISLQSIFENLILNANYSGALEGTIDPAGFAAATNVTFTAPTFIPIITTAKGASLAATLTTIVGTLNSTRSGFGTWVAITNGIRLDDRQVTLNINLGYS